MKQYIIFEPYNRRGNESIRMISNTIAQKYEVRSFEWFGRNWFCLPFIKGFYLNWYENKINRRKKLFLAIMKGMGKKIIWHCHNRQPHDCEDSEKARKNNVFMANVSSKIVIYSEASRDEVKKLLKPKQYKKIVHIEHFNYIGVYKDNKLDLRKEFHIAAEDFVFCTIGMIRPYKNIETMIDCFNELALPHTKLLIAGPAVNGQYAKKIRKIAKDNPDIICSIGFIPDNRMSSYLKAADVMVMPYSMSSAMNSGAMIMAFSYSLPVITVNMEMAQDYTDDILYRYEYKDKSDEAAKLKEAMSKAYHNGKENNRRMGALAKQIMQEKHSAKTICPKLWKLFD